MEFCHNCGAENKEGNKFCIKCGSALKPAEKGVDIIMKYFCNGPIMKYFFIGPLITSLIGAIMLLISPFVEEDFWPSESKYYGALYPESPLFSVIMLCLVALLLYGAYVSYLGLRSSGTLSQNTLKRAFYGATTVFLMSIIIVLFVEWINTYDVRYFVEHNGIYGGFILGGLTAGLLGIAYYMRRKQMLLPGEKKGNTALRNGSFTGQNVEPK